MIQRIIVRWGWSSWEREGLPRRYLRQLLWFNISCASQGIQDAHCNSSKRHHSRRNEQYCHYSDTRKFSEGLLHRHRDCYMWISSCSVLWSPSLSHNRLGLITLILLLVMLTCVFFGFRQRGEVLVIPVATLFAFTQLRASMPGAPDGFGTHFQIPSFTRSMILSSVSIRRYSWWVEYFIGDRWWLSIIKNDTVYRFRWHFALPHASVTFGRSKLPSLASSLIKLESFLCPIGRSDARSVYSERSRRLEENTSS